MNTRSSQYRDDGRAKEIKKIGKEMNATCRGHFPSAILGTRAVGSAALVLTMNTTD